MRNQFHFFVFFLSLMTIVSCATGERALIDDLNGVDVLTRSDQRVHDDSFFQHEFEAINDRRAAKGFVVERRQSRPNRLVGLALSGGGIRASAFHFGILSGLHNMRDKSGVQLLNYIDYISSVSGGSWTNGAYWAWPNKRDEDFFSCLDQIAINIPLAALCQPASNFLRSEQTIESLPILGQRKEVWMQNIRDSYLGGREITFDHTQLPLGRPYPIFNATHSVPLPRQRGRVGHFPFQHTPHQHGTYAESSDAVDNDAPPVYSGEFKGFFLRNDAKDFDWRRRKWQRYWKFWDTSAFYERNSNTLAYALAASSGVVRSALLLEYNFSIVQTENDKPLNAKGLRPLYRISDGGKSDNTGISSLIERRVDIIIAIHMGRETDNINFPFEDFELAGQQAKHFLGCEIADLAYTENVRKWLNAVEYRCPARPDEFKGVILNIKPDPSHISDFMEHMRRWTDDPELPQSERSRIETLINYIRSQDSDSKVALDERFPRTPTLRMNYDEELTALYFLLGKYTISINAGLIMDEIMNNAISFDQ